MKKVFIFVEFVFIIILSGCGKENIEKSNNSEIIGTWFRFQKYNTTIEINEDYTYVYNVNDFRYTGTWTEKNGEYIFTAESGGISYGNIYDDGSMKIKDVGKEEDTIGSDVYLLYGIYDNNGRISWKVDNENEDINENNNYEISESDELSEDIKKAAEISEIILTSLSWEKGYDCIIEKYNKQLIACNETEYGDDFSNAIRDGGIPVSARSDTINNDIIIDSYAGYYYYIDAESNSVYIYVKDKQGKHESNVGAGYYELWPDIDDDLQPFVEQ